VNDALDFAVRVFLKQGIWIGGAAWLFAIGSRMIFLRADKMPQSREDSPRIVKQKIIVGAVTLAVGIVLALL